MNLDSVYVGWHWLRSNLLAITAAAVIIALFVAFAVLTSSPSERLGGTITGFPLLGPKSGGALMFVQLADGQEIAVRLSGSGCAVGKRVRLLKRGSWLSSSYEIAPGGCEAR